MKINLGNATGTVSDQFAALRDDVHTDLEFPSVLTKRERLAAQRAKDKLTAERYAQEVEEAAEGERQKMKAEHKQMSKRGGARNEQLHAENLKKFKNAYNEKIKTVTHTKAVVIAARAAGVSERAGFGYAKELGLSSKKSREN